MLREIALFGAGVPSVLLYFLAAVALFLAVDRLAKPVGFTAWSGIRRCCGSRSLFAGLILFTRP